MKKNHAEIFGSVFLITIGAAGLGYRFGKKKTEQSFAQVNQRALSLMQMYLDTWNWIPRGIITMEPDDFVEALVEKASFLDIASKEIFS